MKISILLPVKDYNHDYYLRCINSIITQSYENFEVIVKYNGSEEDFNKLKNYSSDSRIKYVNLPDNSVTQAGNQALEISNGDLINLFAHDDYFCEEAFKTVIDNIGDSMWSFGKLNYHVDNTLISTYYIDEPNIELMSKNNLIPQPTCFWKRQIVDEIGVFDETFKLCWDYDYWVRIMKKYKPKHINYVLANYFLNQNSISIKMNDLMGEEKRLIFEKHFK